MLRSDEIFYNKVKWLLKEGKRVAGAWLQAGSPATAEIFGKARFDFVIVDMEHGPGDVMTLLGQMHALSKFDVAPLVRVPWNDFVIIKRVLDTGAYGVLIPYVNTAEEAAMAVKACKYPLEGIRGLAPSPRAGGYGMNGLNYLENANEQTMVMIAAETYDAVANIEHIAAIPGLDGIFIGPMDLATSMGYFCNPGDPAVQQAIVKIEETAKRAGKFLGTVAASFEQAEILYDKGYSLVVIISDTTSLARLALETVRKFHNAYPDR